MRNLKKILALVLALVMSLSLVTIANAADFTDSDDISYEEAVDVMSTIGVINGMDDGSFDPDGTLTREQAAKLVTYMLLGDNAERLGIETSTFKDVALTRWSAPAIEYCVSLGIIDGAGDGNFYPAGQLTGAAFAKVLLTAIGYDSQKEGLVGASWSVNVSALATEVGLDNGIEDLSWSAPLTREEAAQMALNAIQAPLVTYENDATITVNGAEVTIASGDAYYVTTTLAKEQRISDRQLSNSNDYTVEFGEKYFPRLRLVRETDAFERPSHTWVYENKELGTYVDYDLLTETYTEAVTGRQLYELLGKSNIEHYGITYYVDGVVSTEINAKNMIRGNTVEYGTTGNGVLTQVFVDHDEGEIIITSINTYLAQANSDYNATNETVSLNVFQKDSTGTTKIVDSSDVANITDITKDQFVLVNLSGKGLASGAYDVVKVSDVEILTDSTVTKFSKDADLVVSKLTADGEEYSASQKAFYDKEVLEDYDLSLLTDMTYNIYLDQYGYAIGVDLFQGELNYVFITGYDRIRSNISVKTATAAAIFLNGDMGEITVNVTATNKNIDRMNKVTDDGTSGDNYFVEWGSTPATVEGNRSENRWYTYTESNGTYTLKPAARMFATTLTNMPTDSNGIIKSAYVYLDDSNPVGNAATDVKGRAYGNDDSIYITVEAGSVDTSNGAKDAITDVNGVYSGVQNVEIEVTAGTMQQVPQCAYTLYNSDYYIIASIVLGEAQGSVQNYAYILSGAKSEELKSDGYYYWTFDAVLGGEKVTLEAKTKYSSTIEGLNPYTVQELRFDGDYVSAVEDVTADKFVGTDLIVKGHDIYDIGNVPTGTTNDIAPIGTAKRISGTLRLEGRTLYTNYGPGVTPDKGLALASDAKAVLIQNEGTIGNLSRKVTSCGSVAEAIGRLADLSDAEGLQFQGRIVAVLNSAGVAQWVVIISDNPLVIGGGGTTTPVVEGLGIAVDTNSLQVVAKFREGTPAAAQRQQIVMAMRNAGVNVSYVDLTPGSEFAVDTNGNYYAIYLTEYYEVTVDNVVVDRVATGGNKANIDYTAKGAGTGYLNNSDIYKPYTTKVLQKGVTAVNSHMAFKTGYIETVAEISVNVNGGKINRNAPTVDASNGTATHVKVSDGQTITLTYAQDAAVPADYNVWIDFTTADGTTSTAKQVVSKTALNNGDVKLTFNLGTLSKDITGISVITQPVPATMSITPATVTGDLHGLTVTASTDKLSAQVGDTVRVTVTISGEASANTTLTVSGVASGDGIWSNSETPTSGATGQGTTALVIASGTNYTTPVTAVFTFDVSATAAENVPVITGS